MIGIQTDLGTTTRERRLISLDAPSSGDNTLQHLGGTQRIGESSIGAIGNVAGGTGRLLFKGGERIKGAAQIGQGVLDALDIIPSTVADGVRTVFGPNNPRGPSPYNYNITRAFGSFGKMEKGTDIIGATTDVIHAIGFKAGSDILKAIQKN